MKKDINQKIKELIDSKLKKENRDINTLSKIGLVSSEYDEFLIENNGDKQFLGIDVIKINSLGSSRLFFKNNNKEKCLGIIGTAGRKDDFEKLGVDNWKFMVECAARLVAHTGSNRLVSGGAAWADHVAVKLFLNNTETTDLTLHLPEKFENGKFSEESKTGKTANYYHKLFAQKLGVDTLGQIQKAIEEGVDVKNYTGFFERNYGVATQSQNLLAFTFGDEKELKDGGTKHTFELFCKKSDRGLGIHCNLNNRKIYIY